MPCYGDLHKNHEHFSKIQDIYLNGNCYSVVNVPFYSGTTLESLNY